jgi:hypothetical protein
MGVGVVVTAVATVVGVAVTAEQQFSNVGFLLHELESEGKEQ